MRTFREILSESEVEIDENWTKEDLINLIQEEDLDQDDIAEITELVMDIVEWGEFDNLSDEEIDSFDWDSWDSWENVEEKMSPMAKKEAAKKRRKPTFKKAQRLKKKCMAKHADKIKKTKDGNTPKVCDANGKIQTGMGRAERRKLAKTRKKNKNKIIN